MKVNLQLFEQSGKFYIESSYGTYLTDINSIFDEVRKMRYKGILPGLVPSGYGAHLNYIVSIDVPGHPNNHPHLITYG